MEIIGYFSTSCFQCAINSSEVNFVPAFGSTYSPFLEPFHSLDAASIAILKSRPGSYPAFFTALRIYWIASSSLARFGANPPSSPTDVASPLDFNSEASAWNTSAHQRSASLKLGAPTGIIMNSCTSTVLAACAPPFKIFIIGTGRRFPEIPPRKRYNGISSACAAALAVAIDTARIALAPSFDLSLVPSAAIIAASIAYISLASIPIMVSAIVVLIFSTALETPFPRYLEVSPSLNSSASNSPVDAPLGAVPLATVPSTSVTSASTVGFPLESKISRPITFSISK